MLTAEGKTTVMKLPKAQLFALEVLAKGPLDERGRRVHRIQERVILSLQDAALAKYQPDEKSSKWVITPAGWRTLYAQNPPLSTPALWQQNESTSRRGAA